MHNKRINGEKKTDRQTFKNINRGIKIDEQTENLHVVKCCCC